MAVPGRVAAVYLALAGATICVGAQQPPGRDTPAAQQPVFRATTTYVVVDVVATDKDDHLVRDLTQADFEIRERGVVQKIAAFDRIDVPPVGRTIDLRAPLDPPPDVFTNAKPVRTARAFVFLIDTARLETEFIVPTKRVLTTFLESLNAGDSAAMVYTGRSDYSQDFTHDTGQLIRAVNHLSDALGPKDADGINRREWPFGRTLKSVVSTLASARESRRVLVVVGHGVPVDAAMMARDPELFEAMTLAKQINVPVYTLDPRGLSAPQLGLAGHMEAQTPEARAGLDQTIFSGQQGGKTLASETGGRAFVNNWNITQAARDLMADNSAYYVLGFYPEPVVQDGTFHEIAVTVKRPGVTLRSRAGYKTEKPPAASAKPPRLVETLESGLPGGALELHATAAPVARGKNGIKTLLTIDVRYAELPSDAASNDRLDLVWLAIDQDAKIKRSGQNTIDVPIGVSTRARTVAVQDLIELPDQQLTLRVAVSSHTARMQGTVHLTLDVPPLDAKPIDVTPLVIGLDGLPPGPTAALGGAASVTPFFPSTVRTFHRGQRMRVFARVFGRSLGNIEPTLALKQGDQTVLSVPVKTRPSMSTPEALECEALLPIEDLPGGRYVLELTVRSGAKTVTRSVVIEIV